MAKDSNSKNIPLIVIDEGSSQIKCAWSEEDTIKTLKIKSLVAEGAQEDAEGELVPAAYEIDGSQVTVNPLTDDPFDNKNEDYQFSDINRVLVHEVLRQAGFGRGRK